MTAEVDWEQVMADYQSLPAAVFDARYPGWYDDEDFMERLREAFGAAAELEKSA